MVLLSDFMQEIGISFGAFFANVGPALTFILLGMTGVICALIILALITFVLKKAQLGV